MYEKSEIESMLREYLKSKSQLEELESKIAKNNVLLKFNGTKMQESKEAAIEGMILNSPVISDMDILSKGFCSQSFFSESHKALLVIAELDI